MLPTSPLFYTHVITGEGLTTKGSIFEVPSTHNHGLYDVMNSGKSCAGGLAPRCEPTNIREA